MTRAAKRLFALAMLTTSAASLSSLPATAQDIPPTERIPISKALAEARALISARATALSLSPITTLHGEQVHVYEQDNFDASCSVSALDSSVADCDTIFLLRGRGSDAPRHACHELLELVNVRRSDGFQTVLATARRHVCRRLPIPKPGAITSTPELYRAQATRVNEMSESTRVFENSRRPSAAFAVYGIKSSCHYGWPYPDFDARCNSTWYLRPRAVASRWMICRVSIAWYKTTPLSTSDRRYGPGYIPTVALGDPRCRSTARPTHLPR